MGNQPIQSHAGSDDREPEVNQPGLSQLREAVANHTAKRLPDRGTVREDGLAGLNTAVTSVPDGLASGLLVGVNPIYGLYAIMAGPIAGGLLSGSRLMVITTTSAASLSAGQAIAGTPAQDRPSALFTLVLLVGVLQIAFGLMKLGRLVRFVSYSVMTGFLVGIAMLTILSQMPTAAGYDAEGESKLSQAADLFANLGETDRASVSISAATLIMAVVLPRTRLGNFSYLVAIVIPSIAVALFGMDSVAIVSDVGEIPRGLPSIFVPSLSDFSFDVVSGALAVAIIILVQGAGVSQSVPNPDGSPRSASRDFIAQGAANVASGAFRGVPVGGSLSTTAVNVLSGARTRWSVIFAGLWVALIVVFVPGVVSYVAMPTLAILLIVASANAIKPADIRTTQSVGWPSLLAAGTTCVFTLTLPIQAAVGTGVVLSALLSLYTSSNDISVVERIKRPDGYIEERQPSKHLASNQVTVLDVYGSLFYAGARTLERMLPDPQGARNAVVILRLRGRTQLGATMIDVLATYADKLREGNGRLYLTGVNRHVYDQITDSDKLLLTGPVRAYEVTPIVGESTSEAYADAQAWLVRQGAREARDEPASQGDTA